MRGVAVLFTEECDKIIKETYQRYKEGGKRLVEMSFNCLQLLVVWIYK